MHFSAHDLGKWFRHAEYMLGVMASRPQPHPLLVAHMAHCLTAFQVAAGHYLREVPGARDVASMLQRTHVLARNFNLDDAASVAAAAHSEDVSVRFVTFSELERWKFHLVHMAGTALMLDGMHANNMVEHMRAYIASSARMLAREAEVFPQSSPGCPMRAHDLRVLHRQAAAIANSMAV